MGSLRTWRIAKRGQFDVIAATSFINGVQRLMQITHKMDHPF